MTVITGARGLRSAGLVVLFGLELGLFVGRVRDLDRATEIVGQHLDGLVAERLRDGHHLAVAHHDLDDLARWRRREAARRP